jgi:hypothetical protein
VLEPTNQVGWGDPCPVPAAGPRSRFKTLPCRAVSIKPHFLRHYPFLDQDSDLTNELRGLLTENGHFPVRRTWERRLSALPDTLPGLIGCLGRHLVSLIQPWGRSVFRKLCKWCISAYHNPALKVND